MVDLKFGVNDLNISGMDNDQKGRFFETKSKFNTKIQNIVCNYLDPIVFSKAWNYQFVKNPIGTCFNNSLLRLCESFPGMVVDLESCQKCKKLFWGCLKGHKAVHWEISSSGWGALYCESCRCSYSRSQIETYFDKKQKEFEKEQLKKSQEYDEYLKKTTFIQAS
jgi:hypothetical protein